MFSKYSPWLCVEDENTSLRLGKTQNLLVSLSASAGLPVLSSSKQRQDWRKVSDPMAALTLDVQQKFFLHQILVSGNSDLIEEF